MNNFPLMILCHLSWVLAVASARDPFRLLNEPERLLILTAQFAGNQPLTSLPPSAAILKFKVTDKTVWRCPDGAQVVLAVSEDEFCHMPMMDEWPQSQDLLLTFIDSHVGFSTTTQISFS